MKKYWIVAAVLVVLGVIGMLLPVRSPPLPFASSTLMAGPPPAKELTRPRIVRQASGPIVDSVFITGSFQAPAASSAGVLDSIRVDLVGLPPAASLTFKPAPLAGATVPYAFRVLAPKMATGTATYIVGVNVWTFRRGLATLVAGPKAPLTIADVPPAGVTNVVTTVAPWP